MFNQKMFLQKKSGGIEIPWIQPALTSDGVIGGDSFAVWTNIPLLSGFTPYIYKAFDGISTGGDVFHSNSGATSGNIVMYNPVPLRYIKMTIKNQTGYDLRSAKQSRIYGSDDNSNYTLLSAINRENPTDNWDIDLSGNSNFYKYYKWEVLNTWDSYLTILEVSITAFLEG